jgi:hypothetical protein
MCPCVLQQTRAAPGQGWADEHKRPGIGHRRVERDSPAECSTNVAVKASRSQCRAVSSSDVVRPQVVSHGAPDSQIRAKQRDRSEGKGRLITFLQRLPGRNGGCAVRVTCDRCGRQRTFSEPHAVQGRHADPRSPRPHAPRRLRRRFLCCYSRRRELRCISGRASLAPQTVLSQNFIA